MLKTISAALLAASVMAAPAFAVEAVKTDAGRAATQTPVIKADQTEAKAPNRAVKADTRTKTMNANASISPDEHHNSVRSPRHHGKMISAKKKSQSGPGIGTVKTTPSTDKRS